MEFNLKPLEEWTRLANVVRAFSGGGGVILKIHSKYGKMVSDYSFYKNESEIPSCYPTQT
jgi:hypothetical protein